MREKVRSIPWTSSRRSFPWDESMPAFEIEIDPELEKALSKLEKKDRVNFMRVGKKILPVAENPYIGKPLWFS